MFLDLFRVKMIKKLCSEMLNRIFEYLTLRDCERLARTSRSCLLEVSTGRVYKDKIQMVLDLLDRQVFYLKMHQQSFQDLMTRSQRLYDYYFVETSPDHRPCLFYPHPRHDPIRL